MSTVTQDGAAVRATKRELLRGILISMVVASVVLVGAVLPAEYGIDPTGVGRLLGLTTLNNTTASAPAAAPAQAAPATQAGASAAPAVSDDPHAGASAAPAVSDDPHAKKPGTVAHREAIAYQAVTREIVLEPGGGIELKARMEKGAALIYSWKTKDGAKIHHEFHGDPVNAKNDEYESYIKDDAVSESKGTLVAPFTGVHGWYWKNDTAAPVTVVLQASGFYAELFNP